MLDALTTPADAALVPAWFDEEFDYDTLDAMYRDVRILEVLLEERDAKKLDAVVARVDEKLNAWNVMSALMHTLTRLDDAPAATRRLYVQLLKRIAPTL